MQRYRHAPRGVGDLVLANPASVGVLRIQVRQIEAADAPRRGHGQALGQDHANLPGDKLLASGCKRQGFWPLSGARHMSQTAAHPVKHLIPYVSVRLWELSLLIPLCVLAARPDRVTPVLQVALREVERHLLTPGPHGR